MFDAPTVYYIIGGASAVVALGMLYGSVYVIVKWLEDTFGRGDPP